MKKLITIVIICAFTLAAKSQSFYSSFEQGKKAYDKGDYQKAYADLFRANQYLKSSLAIPSYDEAEFYYYLGLVVMKYDSTKYLQAAEYLTVSLDKGYSPSLYELAYKIPEIPTKSTGIIENYTYKKIPLGELNYLKANIFAKIDNKLTQQQAFTYLKKAFDGKYVPMNPETVACFIKLDANQYFDLLYQYRFVDSKYNYLIKLYVEDHVNRWQAKGKYEKIADYQVRVTETTRQEMIKVYSKQFVDSVGMLNFSLTNSKSEYDPESETFKITFASGKFIYLKVPIAEAPSFDQNFNKLAYKNPSFTFRNDVFELVSIAVMNPGNGKEYAYNSMDFTEFNPELISYQFEKLEVTSAELNALNSAQAKGNASIDIETNIPANATANPYAFALIIGNEDYQTYQTGLKTEQNVEFAIRDANVVKEYFTKTLGVPANQVLFYANAGTVTMNQALQQIQQITKSTNGKATVMVYYAGHGYPDEKTQEPCLIPVDVNSATMNFAIPLSKLIGACTAYPSEKVVIMLDACFSGGGRNMGLMAARGVTIKPKEVSLAGNVVVFSASSGNQTALPYRDQKHGMFTYYLLKKIQETSGDVSLAELDAYLSEKVPVQAAIINKQEQTPITQYSPAVENDWKKWNLK